MADMSDEQLRRELKKLGVTCGPITPTTRDVYVRKLKNLRGQDGCARSHTKHAAASSASRHSSSYSTGRSLNNLSSDESDHEDLPNSAQTQTSRTSASTNQHASNRTESVRSRSSLLRPAYDTANSNSQNSGFKYDIPSLARPSIRSPGTSSTVTDHSQPTYTSSTSAYRRTTAGNWNGESSVGNNSSKAKPKPPVQPEQRQPWQFVSRLIVVLVLGFLALVVAAYLFTHRGRLFGRETTSNYLPCTPDQHDLLRCTPEADLDKMRTLEDELIDVLSTRAGEYDCGYRTDSRGIKKSEVVRIINKAMGAAVSNVTAFVEFVLNLCEKNEHWGISVHRDEDKTNGDGSLLESKLGKKSLWCRFFQSARIVFGVITLVMFAAGGVLAIILLIQHRRKLAETEQHEVFDLVEQIIDRLRQNAAAFEAAKEDPSAPSVPEYLAIPHVRDALIPLHQRRSKQHIWDQAVRFLSANESRIRVENQKIAGEDFAVWRWIQPSADGPKVWQGQAFGENSASLRSRHHAAVPLTPLATCLKVRNMFDAAVESGDEWQRTIKDAVLDKCQGAVIQHIGIDTSSSDGCVYVRCADLTSAGTAFKALHGWWFDGRLITVKYLREQRYDEHYPESSKANTPLQPSSSARTSLSQPFHRSAIENS